MWKQEHHKAAELELADRRANQHVKRNASFEHSDIILQSVPHYRRSMPTTLRLSGGCQGLADWTIKLLQIQDDPISKAEIFRGKGGDGWT